MGDRQAKDALFDALAEVAKALGSQAGPQPRVVHGQSARHQAELAEPVELTGGLRRHPGERVEVVHLGGDLAAERRGVEAVGSLDGRAAGPHPAAPEVVLMLPWPWLPQPGVLIGGKAGGILPVRDFVPDQPRASPR